MLHACRDISAGLVQAAPGVGVFAIFVQRCCGGNYRRVRVDVDACADGRAIRRARAMGASAAVDAARVDCMVRASLSARRATVVGLERLRSADAGAVP